MGKRAVTAKYELQSMSSSQKKEALLFIADRLIQDTSLLLEKNEIDIKEAQKNQIHPGMIDRLQLNTERIEAIAQGIIQVAGLQDPIGEVLEEILRPNGLKILKMRVPIGVIGIFYESRPNVTADAFALCFQTGNAVILKGGSDALYSNKAITDCIRSALVECKINPDCIQLIETTDRETAKAFMKLDQYVDLLIPRGGAGLIQSVKENSTIPVIETGTGNCHIFVDESADLEKAVAILINSKTQRIGVCNACESLLIHEAIAEWALPILGKALQEKQVEIRGDETTMHFLPFAIPATEEDYGKEFLDFIISVKVVKNLEDAIAHINQYNTKHSDAIITQNQENAEKFLREVDAACVYVNAATRFTDGFMFGFGAEIGISTQKIHARGPMGLKELTSYKYLIYGDGQIRE